MTGTTLHNSTITVVLDNYVTGNPFTIGAATSIITSVGNGVFGSSAKAWTLANAGTVSGNDSGVDLQSTSTVTNSGVITGVTFGGVVFEAGGSLGNTGTIRGNAKNTGVFSAAGGNFSNTGASALISGGNGIDVHGAAGTVTNSARIVGLTYGGVNLTLGGSLTNLAGGAITGGGSAVNSAGAGAAVTNAGSITGKGYAGVDLAAGGSAINEAGGSITGKGTGVAVTGSAGTVTNYGTVVGTNYQGVYLSAGGVVSNIGMAGSITGGTGVQTTKASATVINSGLISGTTFSGVNLGSGGLVSNTGTITGSSGNTAVFLATGGTIDNTGAGAVISGGGAIYIGGAPGMVTNSGLISATNSPAIAIHAGGSLANVGTISGNAKNTSVILANGGAVSNLGAGAVISGGGGIEVDGVAGTVNNSGMIDAVSFTGVFMSRGGGVTNAAGGTISGANLAVVITGGAGTVGNYGEMNSPTSSVIYFGSGGQITNGSNTDTGALMDGYAGVQVGGAIASVDNLGTITATGGAKNYGAGVLLTNGGQVVNGSASDGAALVRGQYGVIIGAAAGTIDNYGTIEVAGAVGYHGQGAILASGGQVTNGSASDTTAVIAGKVIGVRVAGTATVDNFGTVLATYKRSIGAGCYGYGASLNGSATDRKALIEGNTGLTVGSSKYAGAFTVTNFGTIKGDGGKAVVFYGSASTLAVEAGCAFVGSIGGGGGTLDLASGVGVLSGLGGGAVTVSRSMATTTFSDFGVIEIGPGARFSASGSSAVASGDTLEAAGVLTLAGVIANAGLIEASGGGHLALRLVTVTNAGTLTAASGAVVDLIGATIRGGTLSGGGAIQTFGGVNLIDGTAATVFNQGNLGVSDGTSVTIEGAFANSGRVAIKARAHVAHLVVGAAGLTLSGGGSVLMTDDAFNRIAGASGAPTLDNIDNRIAGSGQIGARTLTLINGAEGVIEATGIQALSIDTGTIAIQNAGTIEAAGSGGAAIVSAVVNSGVLEAAGGVLTVSGAVSGSGSAVIAGGALDFASSFSQAVAFTGKSGVLELAHSQSYAAAISGFSKTGGTSLDLRDIGFVSANEASFSGSASAGVLTVSDGTHIARITLVGDYRSSVFTAASDGQGGVIIVDPVPAAPRASAFIAAAASLAGSASGGERSGFAAASRSLQLALVANQSGHE